MVNLEEARPFVDSNLRLPIYLERQRDGVYSGPNQDVYELNFAVEKYWWLQELQREDCTRVSRMKGEQPWNLCVALRDLKRSQRSLIPDTGVPMLYWSRLYVLSLKYRDDNQDALQGFTRMGQVLLQPIVRYIMLQ